MKDKETRKWSPGARTQEEAEKFIKELREMPYDTSKVGQVFITVFWKGSSEIKAPKE